MVMTDSIIVFCAAGATVTWTGFFVSPLVAASSAGTEVALV